MMNSIAATRQRKSDASSSVESSNNEKEIDPTMSWHVDAKSPTTSPTRTRHASFDDMPALTLVSPSDTIRTCESRESSDLSSDLLYSSLLPQDSSRQKSGTLLVTNSRQSIPHMPLFPDHEDIRTTSARAKLPHHQVSVPQMAHIKKSFYDDEASTTSAYFSLSDNDGCNEASSFACLHRFSSSSLSSSSSTSSSSSSDSDSDSTLMSSSSSSRCSMISRTSSISSTSQIGSISNTSNSSAAWSHRRVRMRHKKQKALQLDANAKKLRSRDKFLKKISRSETPSGPAYSKMYTNYMKENEAMARVKNVNNMMFEENTVHRTRRHMLFELFHTAPAGLTQLLFCITHVAIFEFFQVFVQDFLELNDYDNQFLVYACVFFVALLAGRACGSLWEWTNDNTFDNVRFDMHNKLILGDVDARILHWFGSHPLMKNFFEVVSLYLCYLSANHFVMEAMMKNLFDVTDDVIEDLPSMKFPDITTHIKNVLFYGEALFEDASLAAAEHVTAASSSACSVLGGDICDERIFQACNTLDEFKANLTAADGEYLYDEVSFDTYYKIIGDTSAGVYYYESAMLALLCVTLAGAVALKRIGVGFWDR